MLYYIYVSIYFSNKSLLQSNFLGGFMSSMENNNNNHKKINIKDWIVDNICTILRILAVLRLTHRINLFGNLIFE